MRANHHRPSTLFAMSAIGLTLLGCESAAPASPSAAATTIEIAGTWNDGFGGSETIATDKWVFPLGTSAILEFDNAKNTAFLQAPKDDKYNPNKFSKIVWTEPAADSVHYCTVDMGKDTLPLAKASKLTADDKDLVGKGCGGFGWTKLTTKK